MYSVVAWLCTDAASHINGEIVHAVGNRISLFDGYETRRSVRKAGRWTVEELANVVPETFGPELLESFSHRNNFNINFTKFFFESALY